MHIQIQDKNELVNYINSLIDSNSKQLSILANVTSLIKSCFIDASWVGFYLFDKNDNSLYLGPFQGDLACEYIPFGKGVCGTCLKEKKSQLVKDVNAIKNHIACSDLTQSELVVPIIKDDQVVAVIDLDSYKLAYFTIKDQKLIEDVAKQLEKIF